MKYIGIAGQLANGKDMVADHLVIKLNENRHRTEAKWKRNAFANAVKEVYERSFGVDREFVEKWKRIPDPPPGMLMNVRQGLQFVGDGFRKIKDEIWIEIALREDMLILSDSRYINEAKAVNELGGIMVVVARSGFENDDPNPSESQIRPIAHFCAKYLKTGTIWKQVNELDLTDIVPEGLQYYDYFINNDGTLEELYDKVDNMLLPYVEAEKEEK